jgi:hypothetical protein
MDLEKSTFTEQIFNSERRKELERVHAKLRKSKELEPEELEAYERVLKESFLSLLK